MSIAVKICGITSAQAVEASVNAGAVYGGLVFHPNSPRFVTLQAARALAGLMRGRLRSVALIADLGDFEIDILVKTVRPEILQLHGSETPARANQIRSRFSLPVIKAIAVAQASDLQAAFAFQAVVDMLMFDAKPPMGADRPGGHGSVFDWKLLSAHSFSKPWFLAGGLTVENVARAIEASGAKMVDVSSGVESASGVKDAQRVEAFVMAARSPVQA